MDSVGKGRCWETKNGGQPIGEGADVGTEESVDGVKESMVGTKSAVGESGQSHAGAHGVEHVRPRSRHGSVSTITVATQVSIWMLDRAERDSKPVDEILYGKY
uniref:Uncharacterized protein n=1 Tax=Cucumis melo TaxID=3656 RepID=A0A9I9CEA4_CUCME